MTKIKQLCTHACILASAVFLLTTSSCKEELTVQKVNELGNPFESGIHLSYTQKETSFSTSLSKGERKTNGGVDIQSEDREVNIFFDNKKEKYSIKTRRLDGFKSKRKDFLEPEWKEVVNTNSDISMYNELGKTIFADMKTEKSLQDLSYLVSPYPQRSEKMREMLIQHSKTSFFTVEVQNDTNVVKITRVFDKGNEIDESIANFKAVSYVNIKYGVPVISELFDSKGTLVSKVTILYKMIDEIPVVAYEEAISYSTDYHGDVVEEKTIINYENINIKYF